MASVRLRSQAHKPGYADLGSDLPLPTWSINPAFDGRCLKAKIPSSYVFARARSPPNSASMHY